MTDPAHQLAAAQSFCQQHFRECCTELVMMNESGILPDRRIRELAHLCSFAGYSALQVAINIVNTAALNVIAAGNDKNLLTQEKK